MEAARLHGPGLLKLGIVLLKLDELLAKQQEAGAKLAFISTSTSTPASTSISACILIYIFIYIYITICLYLCYISISIFISTGGAALGAVEEKLLASRCRR